MTDYQFSKAVLDVHEQVRQLVDYRIAKTTIGASKGRPSASTGLPT